MHSKTSHRHSAGAARTLIRQARAAFGVNGNLTISSNHSQYVEPTNTVTPDPRKFTTKQGALQLNQPIYKPALSIQLEQSKAQSEQARLQGEQTAPSPCSAKWMLQETVTIGRRLQALDSLQKSINTRPPTLHRNMKVN